MLEKVGKGKSVNIKKQVERCRQRQLNRVGKTNAQLNQQEIAAYCRLDNAEKSLLRKAMDQLKFSTRAYFRILKVARTIADFAGEEQIQGKQLLEAIAYRQKGRQS